MLYCVGEMINIKSKVLFHFNKNIQNALKSTLSEVKSCFTFLSLHGFSKPIACPLA